MTSCNADLLISIIIPYYNTLELTKQLLNMLVPQLNDRVEVILIDDGCFATELDVYPIKIIHQSKSPYKSAGQPRNVGLAHARGKYVAFIDSDDLIAPDYIHLLFAATATEKDCYLIGWKAFGQHFYKFLSHELPDWNCSVWSRMIKRSCIKVKFNEAKVIAEDYEFVHLNVTKGMSIGHVQDYAYYYRTGRADSIMASYKE